MTRVAPARRALLVPLLVAAAACGSGDPAPLADGGPVDAVTPIGDGPGGGCQPNVTTLDDSTTGAGLGQFDFQGAWSTSTGGEKLGGGDHYSDDPAASCDLRFHGRAVRLLGARAAHHGLLGVAIDGGAEQLVDAYAADRQEQAILFESALLADGDHTLRVRVTGTSSASASGAVVAVDGARVSCDGTFVEPAPPDAAPRPDAPEGTVPRPAWNTGVGFYVVGSKVYDPNGVELRMRGLNHTHWWGSNQVEAIPHIARANPNVVRVVFGPGMGASTPEARRAVAQTYIDHEIVPMVEWHGATCESSAQPLRDAVDLWLEAGNVAWLKDLERYTLLNIANEWGPADTVYRDEYIDAIARLRAAGVKNLIVIDAGVCGQDGETIVEHGPAIFDSDPEKNVVFSIHMYNNWLDPGDPGVGAWGGGRPFDLALELDRMVATGLPLICGEFSWDVSDFVTYTTRTAIEEFDARGVGWLAWSWNQNSDPIMDLVTGWQYDSPDDLRPYGALIVTDPQLGLQAVAEKATIF